MLSTRCLSTGDRAGFYLTYYAMTDSAGALLQSKIATFSGLTGAAFAANCLLQDNFPQYPGIYFLSQKVARSAFNAIQSDAMSNGIGLVTDQEMFQSATAAWRGTPDSISTCGLPVCRRSMWQVVLYRNKWGSRGG